jgi:hypothetical protein
MDSITRIKNYIESCFPDWEKVDFSEFDENIDFRKEWSGLYKINGEEIILISYTNISITGTDRVKPQLRVFLDEYKKPFYFAKKHQLRYYLFSIFTKEDNMARGLNNFNPKDYIISIETNLDIEGSRRDLRSIYDYANEKLNGRKFLKCTRANYKADINQASFIYVGSPEKPEKETFEAFINIFDSRPYINSTNDTNSSVIQDSKSETDGRKSRSLQQIFFGTPGSGKSWTIKQKYEQDDTKVFRTTFHPDTDYASFVGCYKPVKDKEDEKKIVYEFVSQAFTDAYVAAWSDLDNPYYLIIEEINRGNCAQIFGDLFQLLDRNKYGYSEYPIKADHDLRDYLEENLPEDSEGIRDGKLCLPPNLSIIASMNTSDQSLFPMDSAFKRRWSWEYVPIDYENSESGAFTITIGGETYNWHKFLKAVNEKIKAVTSSEDKQMGNFFIKSSVDEKEFCDKVMFYLWSEVGKDNYQTNDAIFKYYTEDDKLVEFSFNELYEATKKTGILKGFIRYIEEEK